MKARVYRAYGTVGSRTGDSPRAAALAYLELFPKARKVSIAEGYVETDEPRSGFCMLLSCAVGSHGKPLSFRDVPTREVHTLPDAGRPLTAQELAV
jgi:hypothetical protein